MRHDDDPLYEEYPELARMPLADSVAFLARQLMLIKRPDAKQA